MSHIKNPGYGNWGQLENANPMDSRNFISTPQLDRAGRRGHLAMVCCHCKTSWMLTIEASGTRGNCPFCHKEIDMIGQRVND